jgi:hypothetical protein
MGLGRPKDKSSRNRFKMDVSIDLADMNPTQLKQAQTDTICEIYNGLFVLSKKQNFC